MQPVHLCLSHDNKRLFVTDMGNHLVQVLNKEDGTFIQTIGNGQGKGPGQFLYTPWGVCISPDGRELYVADQGNHRINVFNTIDGTSTRSFGQGQIKYPLDVCVSRDGEELYVSETFNLNGGIQVLRISDGSRVRTIGNELDQNDSTDGLCLSPDNELLFVACGKKIEVFRTRDGAHVLSSVFDEEDGKLSGICLSPNGEELYVTNSKFLYSQVYVLRTEDGSLIRTLGDHGQNQGEFISPQGVCVSPDGEMFVADTGNYRVQVFQI